MLTPLTFSIIAGINLKCLAKKLIDEVCHIMMKPFSTEKGFLVIRLPPRYEYYERGDHNG